MTRSLSITAAEWASIKDGDLWLVRPSHRTFPPLEGLGASIPIEFVQVCAPCETCGGSRCVPAPDCHCTAASSMNYSLCNHPPADCPDCRIELVGPCPTCAERVPVGEHVYPCPDCLDDGNGGTVTLGHAYAVGQPLPIYSSAECFAEKGEYCIYVQQRGGYARLRFWPKGDDITDRLAHYGPPESLVGKWALRLAVES